MAPRTTWLLALLVALASGCTTLAQYHAGDAAAAPEDSELVDGRTDDAGVRADVAAADATCSSQRLLITQGDNIGGVIRD